MNELQKDKESIIAELRGYHEVLVYEDCDASINYVSDENRLSRKQALSDYTRYANNSEGSEHERMMTVVEGIKSGLTIIFDDVGMQMAYDKAHPENDGGKTKRAMDARDKYECSKAKYWASIAELCDGKDREDIYAKADDLEKTFRENKEKYPFLSLIRRFEALTMDYGLPEKTLMNAERTFQAYANGDVNERNGELVVLTPAYKPIQADDMSHDLSIILWCKGVKDFNALLAELKQDKPQTFTKTDIAVDRNNTQKGQGRDE